MQITGYIQDSSGKPIAGSFGILDVAGNVLAGPAPTDAQGYFEGGADEGQFLYFSAPGHITKVFPVTGWVNGQVIRLGSGFPWAAVLIVGSAVWIILRRRKRGTVGALNFTAEDVKTIAYIIGGVLAFDTIKKILEALGFWKDADARALDHAASDPGSFWNPNFWQQSQNYSYAISPAMAEQYAQTIHDALGWFNDDEAAVIAVFHQLHTKANISYLAYVYAQKYSADLFATLRGGLWPYDGLSDSDLNQLNLYGQSLPDF